MANTFKQVIPTANKKKSTKQYDFDHISTTSFFRPMPIACKEVVPNMEVEMGLDSFVRLNPLVKPSFGRARVNNRCFFVPMRTIFPRWNEFLASEPIYSLVDGNFGLQLSVPTVTNKTLLDVLIILSAASTVSDYDFSYVESGITKYRTYTSTGRFALSVFISLGYKVNFNYGDTTAFSAMPIMAYTKAMIDWYYPSQYINSSEVSTVFPYLQSDSLSARAIPANVVVSMITIASYCCYNDSLLVDAWDRPVAPNNGVEQTYILPDITLPSNLDSPDESSIGSAIVTNGKSNQTPIGAYNVGGDLQGTYPATITQYQHDLLKALTDYTTRHRLSGVRAVDRLLSEYGINLSSEILKRSVMLGSDTYNIQFGDVMAHSDTYNSGAGTGASLGDYAGKGIGYGNHVFNYKLGNEFGFLLVISSVIPDVQYYQGVNRHCKHLSVMDFWHSDFDGLGVQAVASDEVYMPEEYDSAFSLNTIHSHVFGFVPRYAEYKCSPSYLTGLFAIKGNDDIKSFALMRDLKSNFLNVNAITHDIDFVRGVDSKQYNRIFYNNDSKDDVENFIFINHFEVTQTDETAPLYDTYDFKEVNRAVEVHTQASKVN